MKSQDDQGVVVSERIDLDELDNECTQALAKPAYADDEYRGWPHIIGGLVDRIRELEDLAIDYRSLAADEGYPRRAAYITGIIEKGAVRRG